MWDVWQWFLRLRETRGSAMGEGPICEIEIQAFFRNRHIQSEGWMTEAIVMLDRLSRHPEENEEDYE